ncbi:hypothetical protein [Legionella jordanis]|uniref:Coiled-coil protein n=1 Tax=Legionella jordanis TaxID=456 RepID=A0A0W0V9G4_9GAMM|nr:hypothetical protein [Legionella jordanis]KTD16789.1 hypothetical protein Ljor_1095 [Legionella jordanis]RMX03684.1 hypothetical protein EAW55_04770 [Legionella jordanis]RMX22254.1 hypothetical protein EAS68_01655 [Legionella jordanis]VEH11743.1 Uncharacterised protein [Legionella jordanis]HAT8712946.1 hypothetical protein [Legionella jordanis]
MPAESAKTLLLRHIQQQYQQFLLTNDQNLVLPAVSNIPWIGRAAHKNVYTKNSIPVGAGKVNFIRKNDEFYSFQWQTNSRKLKEAVRWGIVRTESITGKVISTLGNYRLQVHESIAKGMIGNTHPLKLQLVDFYQQRFEALQGLESLVNEDNLKKNYKDAFNAYLDQLERIYSQLDEQFSNTDLKVICPQAIDRMKSDIQNDIQRAKSYLLNLHVINQETIPVPRSYNRARGRDSILEFVKQQMLQNLYEMQGINQDITYSQRRTFALTRGSLNDYIEDARKEIEDHQADLRNAVRPEHHGLYSSENDSLCYDFGEDHLHPDRQRQVLLAISFIEGADQLDLTNPDKPQVGNGFEQESLTVIAATHWKLHRNALNLIKSSAHFIFNIFKGMFLYTHPWEEETWENPNFHLQAAKLRAQASPNEPLLIKPIKFLKVLGHSLKDCFIGIRNVGAQLIIHLPAGVFNDWNSSKELQDFTTVAVEAETEIAKILDIEHSRLCHLLQQADFMPPECQENNDTPASLSETISTFAKADYHLTAGEQNDILNAIIRGFDGFSSVFTHNLFAKDPVAGLIFTAAYSVGAGAIVFPKATAAVFGQAYVNWFANFSYSMGSTKLAATIGGGSTQAQAFAAGWDSLVHGPDGLGFRFLSQIIEDPLTYGSYLAVAYGLGYVLVNGINGHPIPFLSDMLKEDLGSTPEASYAFIGAKFAIAGYELFQEHGVLHYEPIKIQFNGRELEKYRENYVLHQLEIEQFKLAFWLSSHAVTLPKLDAATLYKIERHIDKLFRPAEAAALKKILYPERQPSIAFQLFSIPLTYIPAVLRLVVALFLTLAAWINKNPHPLNPLANAFTSLKDKLSKDLSRILVAFTYACFVCFNIGSSIIKVFSYTTNMIIGRIAALFDWHPGHAMHRFFGAVHTKIRGMMEWLYPVRIIKNVVSASPAHIIREHEASYHSILESLKAVDTDSFETSDETPSSEANYSPFFSTNAPPEHQKTCASVTLDCGSF